MPGLPDSDWVAPSSSSKAAGDVAAVHATGRALVGRAEDDLAVHRAVDLEQAHGRGQRVGLPDERAVLEHGVGIATGVGRLGEPLVERAVGPVPSKASATRASSSATSMIVSVGAAVATSRSMMMRIESASRRISTRRDVIWAGAGSCQRPLSAARTSVSASAAAGRRPPVRSVISPSWLPGPDPSPRRRCHRSKSTMTGAWSLGCLPLRALRSMSTLVDARPAAPTPARGRCACPCPCGSCRRGSPTRRTARRRRSAGGTRRPGPSPRGAASAARSGSLTWVAPTNAAGSYTSRSSGAMLKSPQMTSGVGRVAVVVEQGRAAGPASASLYW